MRAHCCCIKYLFAYEAIYAYCVHCCALHCLRMWCCHAWNESFAIKMKSKQIWNCIICWCRRNTHLFRYTLQQICLSVLRNNLCSHKQKVVSVVMLLCGYSVCVLLYSLWDMLCQTLQLSLLSVCSLHRSLLSLLHLSLHAQLPVY